MAGISVVVSVAGIGFGLIWLIRRHFGGKLCPSKSMMNGKTVIITGGNTGIGKMTAFELAKRNARVILACRNTELGKQAASEIRSMTGNSDVIVKYLDLASFDSIKNFCNDIVKSEPNIHVLINNAGVYGCPYSKTENGFEMQFGVNHLGHFLLTNLLLDLMKNCAPSRIVVVSSLLHKRGEINFDDLNSEKDYKPRKVYNNTKLANALFARELSRRLAGSNVSVYCLHPGIVWTDLGRHMTPGYSKFFLYFVLYPMAWLFTKRPLQGAQTTVYCSIAEELEGVSGRYYGDCMEKQYAPAALDDEVAKKLWDVSAKMVGI